MQWLDRPDDELTGHYRLVRGYDQTAQVMIVNDSYNGPMLRFAYAEFDRLWRPFNRLYIPIANVDACRPVMSQTISSIFTPNNDLASDCATVTLEDLDNNLLFTSPRIVLQTG